MQGLPVVYKPMSASGVVKDRNGEFYGVVCNTSATGIITVYDDAVTATGNVLLGPVTLVAGQSINFNSIGVKCAKGIYVQLVSGAAQFNVLYN